MRPRDIARFWTKVSVGRGLDACWRWDASVVQGKGYGQFKLDGKMLHAHRLAYELIHGPIPGAMHVCHRCDNPSCVNPDHLFVGSAMDNVRDCMEKGRRRRGAWGEASNFAKITAEQVLDIREMARQSFPQWVIAEKHGISRPAVSVIVNRKTWTRI